MSLPDLDIKFDLSKISTLARKAKQPAINPKFNINDELRIYANMISEYDKEELVTIGIKIKDSIYSISLDDNYYIFNVGQIEGTITEKELVNMIALT